MSKIRYLFGKPGFFITTGDTDILDKDFANAYYVSMMLNRTQQLFKYENLPDTIPARDLELLIQTNGFACIAEVDGSLYAFYGALGGAPNPYYMPTLCVVANPALNISREFVIDKDCIIIPNDSMYMGLLPMYKRYAMQITENDITLYRAGINTRIMAIITANDERSYKAAQTFMSSVEKGKTGIVRETDVIGEIKAQPLVSAGSAQGITSVIEYQQYLKAGWLNDLGLSANYNMKREAINSAEAQLGETALLPFIDNMLEMRKIAVDKINKMFDTDISVDVSSAWEKEREYVDNYVDNEDKSDENTEEMKEGESDVESENS